MAGGQCERLAQLRQLRQEREEAFCGGDFGLCAELKKKERELAATATAELRRMMDDVHRQDGDYSMCAEYKKRMLAIDEFVGGSADGDAAASTPGLSAAASEASAPAAEATKPATTTPARGPPKLSARGPATRKDVDRILELSWSEALSAFPRWRAYLSEESKRRRELHQATGPDSFGRRVRAAFDQREGAIREHIASHIDLFRAEQAAVQQQGCARREPAGPPEHSKTHVTLQLTADKWVQVKRGDVLLRAGGQSLPPAGDWRKLWWCGFESTRRRCKHVRPLVATEEGQKAAEYDGQHDCRSIHLRRGLVHYYLSRVNQPAE
eukprot:TRINITY_DN758_c0_g1_i1.p1 TRINITY_DN758_c0_g1~~TRINITY_DN758_c0_g1_i1.p1  ORF type:complete len:345 (+),score=142.35 TRINITY_DN758_c0_g1_i1:64-1035(+)